MIMTLRTNAIIDNLRQMTADDLIRIIDAANYELALMLDEERAKRDYDDLLARQYDDAFETCNYALEDVK